MNLVGLNQSNQHPPTTRSSSTSAGDIQPSRFKLAVGSVVPVCSQEAQKLGRTVNHDSAIAVLRVAACKAGILMMARGALLGLMQLNCLSIEQFRKSEKGRRHFVCAHQRVHAASRLMIDCGALHQLHLTLARSIERVNCGHMCNGQDKAGGCGLR